MKRKRLLSIDFDYFIGTDINTRNNKFPDGVDEKPKEELEKEWNYFYERYPDIRDIRVLNRLEYTKGRLSNLKRGEVLIADSHSAIGELFPKINRDEELEVLHIDFHHDNYISGGSNLDCANWVRHLMNQRDEGNTDILWCMRPDSEEESLMGEFPYPKTEDLIIDGEFDYIFICFSPEWTPPHLYPKFLELCRCVEHLIN